MPFDLEKKKVRFSPDHRRIAILQYVEKYHVDLDMYDTRYMSKPIYSTECQRLSAYQDGLINISDILITYIPWNLQITTVTHSHQPITNIHSSDLFLDIFTKDHTTNYLDLHRYQHS